MNPVRAGKLHRRHIRHQQAELLDPSPARPGNGSHSFDQLSAAAGGRTTNDRLQAGADAWPQQDVRCASSAPGTNSFQQFARRIPANLIAKIRHTHLPRCLCCEVIVGRASLQQVSTNTIQTRGGREDTTRTLPVALLPSRWGRRVPSRGARPCAPLYVEKFRTVHMVRSRRRVRSPRQVGLHHPASSTCEGSRSQPRMP